MQRPVQDLSHLLCVDNGVMLSQVSVQFLNLVLQVLNFYLKGLRTHTHTHRVRQISSTLLGEQMLGEVNSTVCSDVPKGNRGTSVRVLDCFVVPLFLLSSTRERDVSRERGVSSLHW